MKRNLTTRGGVFYARTEVNGRQQWRSLDTRDRREAERALPKMLAAMRGQVAPSLKGTATTIGEIIAAYQSAAMTRRMATGRPAVSSVQQYTWSLLHVVGTATGHDDPASLPAAVLTRQLAEQFVTTIVSKYGPSKEADGRSAAAHCLRNSRAIFSGWAMAAMNLNLPDLSGFRRFEATPRRVKYELLPAEIRAAIANGAETLRTTNPTLWVAFALQRAAGLRANEAAHAQWSWLVPCGDGMGIRVPEHIAKNKKRRTVPLHPDTVAQIEATRRPDDPYILAGGYHTLRYNLIKRTLAQWLRGCGLTRDRWPKAGHELRKLAGADWYTEHGIEVCAQWLGDTLQVAWQYYSDLTRQPKPLKMVG